MPILHILIDAVQVVHRPSLFFWCVEEVDAEGEVGLLVVEHAHDGGQDVYLLGNLVLYLRLALCIAGFKYNNR